MKKVTKNDSNKALKPFIAPGSTVKISKKEIEERKINIEKAKRIGQDITKVDSEEEYENPYRVKALCYIYQNKEVTDKLKRQIEEFDIQHKKKCQLQKTDKE